MSFVVAVGGVVVAMTAGAAYLALQSRFATPIERLGKVVYAGDDPGYRLLHSHSAGIRGRPDFIVKRGPHDGLWWSAYRPVEFKTAKRPQAPRARDVAQLAAYGLLVQQTFGSCPRWGYLQYADGQPMRVRLGARTEKQVRRLLSSMRSPDRYPASLPLDGRCRGCFMRASCPLVRPAL
ncbi:MAG: CRISPR-associated protein Cas4 [Thermoplasmatota archaeon]